MWLEEALRVFTHLTTLSLCCKIILLIVKQIHQVKKTVRLGGRFHTPVLDNTMKIPYLRTTPETETKGSKKGTLFKDREPQKPYLILQHVPI